MLLHLHHLDNNTDLEEVYVIHAAPAEARLLADAIYSALGRDPEAVSYNITLGRKVDLELSHSDVAVAQDSGLTLPPEQQLILP